LEIGGGPGFDAQHFQDQGFCVTAIDNTPAMIKLATQRGVSAQLLDAYELGQLETTFDAVYSMNCLLHIPQKDFAHILQLVADRLDERGLFYLGLWGGDDFEGIWEQDSYAPQRFFSFRSTETLLDSIRPAFQLEYYRRVEFETFFFNSLIARKR
jgi:SAM-dependent methyltransferase